MKQIDIDRMVDAQNMSPEHKNILRTALGYAAGIGTPEDFTFTLEDGSTVTKSIRVISTTSEAGA